MARHHANHHYLDIPLATNTAASVGGGGGVGRQGPGPAHGYFYRDTISPLHLNTASATSITSPIILTRVELHKQRVREQNNNAAALVSQRIPGYKTSAAFLGSLRTNLSLHASPLPPSPLATPPSMRSSATSLPPPSPLATPVDSVMGDQEVPPAAHEAADPLAGVPELHSYRAIEDGDKIAALKLVADSVAQMRQTSNRTLIQHPLNLAVVVALLSLLARYMRDSGRDWITIMTTITGLLMVAFAACRFATKNYLFHAETINWEWLGDADVLVTKFGDEIIGALVLEWVSGESRQKRKKAWRGEIKAWTVRMRYRHKGVGTALLEDAVKEAKKKGAESLDFADDHANSLRVLPAFYNGTFDKGDRVSREILQDLWLSSPTRSKRK